MFKQGNGTAGLFGKHYLLALQQQLSDSHPKAEPRKQRGLAFYTLASRLQK
jgi:hypothetical protein